MKINSCLLLVLVVNLISVSLSEDDTCVYKECTCAGNKVTCENLDKIPPLFNGSDARNITIATFVNGNITEIEDNSLPPNLTNLYFVRNPLVNISLNAFQASAATLKTLIFAEVALKTLPDALLQVKNLTFLTLNDIEIKDWNEPVLYHINSTLRTIFLRNVNLNSWPLWLSDCPLLTYIDISKNEITPIPDTAFDRVLNTLETLDMFEDNLQTVPKAISGLTHLNSLYMQDNNISDIRGIPRTKLLDLNSNAISDATIVTAALIPSSDKLVILNLKSNKLTDIPDLSNMIKMDSLVLSKNLISNASSGSLPQSLTQLYLSENKLSSVPNVVASLSRLQTLDLSSNFISQITDQMIPPQLRELHLDGNQISNITSFSFPADSSLIILELRSNPINQIDPLGFQNLKNLDDLKLDGTQLTSVPKALTSLVKLTHLSMENIPLLTCTLPLNCDLVSWFKSGKLVEVKGYCNGTISIQDFYTVTKEVSKCGFSPLLSNWWVMLACLFLVPIMYLSHV